jgi:hypothetical protein
LSQLADYGITAEQLDKFAALVEAFDEKIGKPKSAIRRRKIIRDNIKALIKEIEQFLDETLDGWMLVFRERVMDTAAKKARRAFFNAYTEAKEIDDAAATRAAAPAPAPQPAPSLVPA